MPVDVWFEAGYSAITDLDRVYVTQAPLGIK